LAKGTLLVKLVDDAGKTLAQDARSFLALKELQTVVVQGRLHRDGADSVSLVASGIYKRE
jgi:hypothetical protein